MENMQRLSHEVAVNAYLIRSDRFLLLKRCIPPAIWGPPGGRLELLEDPVSGLKREVMEETGLEIMVLEPVTTWFGRFNGRLLLSIDYLCHAESDQVRLSAEHSDFRWLSITGLRQDRERYCSPHVGFKLTDYEKAWRRYLDIKR
jgi:8-oxo-dGTP diphosphatase